MEITEADPIPSYETDPCKHLDHLGHGAYGYVDKVCLKPDQAQQGADTNAVYARKVIRITSGWNRANQFRGAINEFKILSRLKHDHIVKVLYIYKCRNRLSILMDQVADCDMEEYLQVTDELQHDDPIKYQRKLPMLSWTGCLIQAIDYLHEMKIKHKDLKPANILIKENQVLIADFGISKDLIDQETTASLSSNGGIGTRMYCAPEVLQEDGRRGRASDMYSLGCIFLEISTVLVSAGSRSLKSWSDQRELSGSRLYSRCSFEILRWLQHLWSIKLARLGSYRPFTIEIFDDVVVSYGAFSGEVAFLMLDPNPKTRITARQMVALLQLPGSAFSYGIKANSCFRCRYFPTAENPNIPPHSIYKYLPEIEIPLRHDDFLSGLEAEGGWEQAKRLLLESHMWW